METLRLDDFEVFTDNQVRWLPGGQFQGKHYSLAILRGANSIITDIYNGQLRYNRQSQKQCSRYPHGYHSFQIGKEIFNFALQTNRFEVSRLNITNYAGKQHPWQGTHRKEARILKTPAKYSEQFLLMEKMSRLTEYREQIRKEVGTNLELVEIVGDLLQWQFLGTKPATRLESTRTSVTRFEFYIERSTEECLKEMLSLLRMDPN